MSDNLGINEGVAVTQSSILFFDLDDTQMIVGGERKNTLTPEEYVVGAILLYLDIINIFVHLLRILSAIEN